MRCAIAALMICAGVGGVACKRGYECSTPLECCGYACVDGVCMRPAGAECVADAEPADFGVADDAETGVAEDADGGASADVDIDGGGADADADSPDLGWPDTGLTCAPDPAPDGGFDLPCSTIIRVSVRTGGAEAEGRARRGAAISGDGHLVAFTSSASDLVEMDANGVEDVFVRDLVLGTTERVSLNTLGDEGNAASYFSDDRPFISMTTDGRFVSFGSRATNLDDAAVVEAGLHLYVRDRASGSTEIIDINDNHEVSRGGTPQGRMSADAQLVAFFTYSGIFATPDSTMNGDIYMRDRPAAHVTRVTDDSRQFLMLDDLSADGRFVLGSSPASTLNAFLIDRSNQNHRFDIPNVPVTDAPVFLAMSADQRWISLRTGSALAAADTNTQTTNYLYDRTSSTAVPMDLDFLGRFTNAGDVDFTGISADGMRAVFSTPSSLDPSDMNASSDIYVYDRCTARARLVSVGTNALAAGGANTPVISADGRFVAFRSSASNLVNDDANGSADIFVARVCAP